MIFQNDNGYWVLGTIVLLLALWVGWTIFITVTTEEVAYTVLNESKEYEIRQYSNFIIAETQIEGTIFSKGNNAFPILFNYISGNNEAGDKISMTAPVLSEPKGSKIAMTTPVLQDSNTFSFVLPASYTIDSAPKPKDSRITLKESGELRVAVLRFSGSYSESNFEEKMTLLDSYLKRDGLKYSQMTSAVYSPPGTLFFLRRLEVWAFLDQK